MPVPRTPQSDQTWIRRDAEDEFKNLLNDKQAYVLPIIGVGGAGKSSLLRRFFSHCQQHNIPALYLDLPHLAVTNAWDIWLRLDAIHCPQFEEKRSKLGSSYETLSAMLKTYGDNASSAADLLQKSLGEEYGIVVGALKDTIKIAYEYLEREENAALKNLLKKPEEMLLRALTEDFSNGGVILVDTLEQASKQILQSRLVFKDDGNLSTPPSETSYSINFLGYCAGIAHFIFDKPVILVLAGRPPAIRDLGTLSFEYFAPTLEVPAFTDTEIKTYLEQSLPRHISAAQPDDIIKLRQLTNGNPFLLERLARLLANWQSLWQWQTEQWQPLLKSYQQDERHGLLLYVTQRLLTHVLPNDQDFWRLAIPRQSLRREMAELLFPKEEFNDVYGIQRLKAYEENGLIYREQDPDLYYLHDETRAAFIAWARRENVWLDQKTSFIHMKLENYFLQKINKELLIEILENWNQYSQESNEKIFYLNNPIFLNLAYHQFMMTEQFEKNHNDLNITRYEFWNKLEETIAVPNKSKFIFAYNIQKKTTLELEKLLDLFESLKENFTEIINNRVMTWLIKETNNGNIPEYWFNNEAFLIRANKLFPKESIFLYFLKNKSNNPEVLFNAYRNHFSQLLQVDKNSQEIIAIITFIASTNYKETKSTVIKAIKNIELTNAGISKFNLVFYFYRLLYIFEDFSDDEILIRHITSQDIHYEGWNFSEHIAQAEREGHPNVQLLKELAALISTPESHANLSNL